MRGTALLALLLAGPAMAAAPAQDAATFFELRIRPVLAGTCQVCHGGKQRRAGLRVDSRAALLRGGDSGPAVVPGKPEQSLLIQAIRRTHSDIKMPPKKRLPPGVVADFVTWVQNGATWPQTAASGSPGPAARHWAFVPVRTVEVPPADRWCHNPVDCFVRAGLRQHGLRPVGRADRRTLLRRVYFDLVGLPPAPEDMRAFLADRSPDAYRKVVERLLASPGYGECWGRHWMDVARYADTAGDNADYPVPESHLYRDYVIDAFNADKPYDQFVREQLAGDLLARQSPQSKYAERVVATGFLALSRRYGTGPYELWHLTLEDTIDTTGRAFLGLTLRCARCHDHKFDPVTRDDYYALYGIFAGTQFPWAGSEETVSMKRPREHFVPLLPPAEAGPRLAAYRQGIRHLEAEIRHAETEGRLAKRLAELDRQMAATFGQIQALAAWKQSPAALATELVALYRERDAANRQQQATLQQLRDRLELFRRPGLPADVPGAYAVAEGSPVDAYVQIRGDVHQVGPTVKRGVPRFLNAGKPLAIPPGSSGRLQLADWLTRPDNPLVARVMVNRIWLYHFGKGLVTTPSNFGLRGDRPTHPELLDWLAARFVQSGWSIKAVHRLIVLSRTYQLASDDDEADAAADPANRWYWRHDRRRLDAEAIRDAMLQVGGRLDLTRPGAQPFPPIDTWRWTQHLPFKDVYPSRRRGVYLMTQRFQRHPYLALFDGADTNTSVEQRRTSIVPLQALFLMNDPFVKEQAEGLARRLLAASADPRQRVERALELAWCRPARPPEREKGVRYVDAYMRELAKIGVPSKQRELEAWTSYARVLLCANEFVYLD